VVVALGGGPAPATARAQRGARGIAVTLARPDVQGIELAGPGTVARAFADGPRVEPAGLVPVTGIFDKLARVVLAGRLAIARIFADGPRIGQAGPVPVAGVSMDGGVVKLASIVPCTGVAADGRCVGPAGKIPIAGAVVNAPGIVPAG